MSKVKSQMSAVKRQISNIKNINMLLNKLTIKTAHQGLIEKQFSAVELVTAYLARIKKDNPQLNDFITLTEESALQQAQDIDTQIVQGEQLSYLAGIPYAAKDIFLTQGIKTTAASKILADFIAPYESTTTQRLKQAGAILVGKTNLDEFAMGSSTENSAFGPTKNPLDKTRVAGGSSGGSAAAMAADHCLFALGTDTGGSIRQPASFCGVIGLKPTYGRTSRYGVISMASSLDTIGHFAKNVEDAAIILQTIAGRDKRDATSSPQPLDNYLAELKQPIKSLKIGLPKEYFEAEGMDPQVKSVIEQGIKQIEELVGQSVKILSLPHTSYALATYYIIMPAEVSSNLARYDGIRYGLSVEAQDLLRAYLKTRSQGLGSEVKRRVILGTYTLSSGYYDAYYKKALQVRTLIKRDFEQAFQQVDLILAPTAPTPAFKLGEKTANPLQMYLSDIFTIPASLAGLPALSLPAGKVDNLPVGLQIIGRQFEERTILCLAYHFEQANLSK